MVRHPIHSMIVPIPLVCFVAALLTDLAYWNTAEMMWADFSAWLVTAGLITALLAAVVGLMAFFRDRRARAPAPAWPHAIGEAVVLMLALSDTLVHSRDAWTSVVPVGLILSAVLVVAAIVTGWMGWTMAHRSDAEVTE